MTLGRHSGAAVLGNPLDVRVQAILGPEDSAGTLCVKPQVYFGESMVPSSEVDASVQQTAPDARPSLRIRTTRIVNEPIVTLELTVGCNAPFARRYVLLADPAPAVAAAEKAAAAQEAARAAQAATAPSVESRRLGSDRRSSEASAAEAARKQPSGSEARRQTGGQSASSGEAKTRQTRQRLASTEGAKPPSSASVVRKPEPPKPEGPRLTLEPIDINLGIDRDPVLRLSTELLSTPASTPEAREAAARLWKAINASPEEIMRDAQKLAVLEAEAKGLREQEASNLATIEALKAEAGDNKTYRYATYLLGGLLLLTLGGLLLAWRRKGEAEAAVNAEPFWYEGKPAGAAAARSQATGVSLHELDLDLDDELDDDSDLQPLDSDASIGEVSSVGRTSRLREDSANPSAMARSMATEELFDIQQQTDFFLSLGEPDKAVEVLENHLNESSEPSPLAFLDLLAIYHDLGRKSDYEYLRDEFNRQFNAGAPAFDDYSAGSHGLADYETAFSRIQALWPQRKVLEVIEQSIFRDPADTEGEVFDLEAYRELLLLHSMAKELVKHDASDSEPPENDFEHTAIKPLKAVGRRGEDRVTEPMGIVPASSKLGLDIDLDKMVKDAEFEDSLPEAMDPPVRSTSEIAREEAKNEGNLIDFEVLDLGALPDDEDKKS
ncbi:hypothetical protein [Hydrogenophaga sp. 5NK40-0174]|uniref:hypothetical protein n=1 Tax=Hydrogenophaga sp. 5NK40-0174 TaxID=3127649 RepID=UPI0031077E38